MAEMKTRPTGQPVGEFFASLADPQMRADCRALARLMSAATGSRAKMWGNIVGFGSRKLRYANGKETDWMVIAFAPRASSIALYLGPDDGTFAALKESLGKYRLSGKSCLHIRRLADVHLPSLEKLIAASARSKSREPVRSARC